MSWFHADQTGRPFAHEPSYDGRNTLGCDEEIRNLPAGHVARSATGVNRGVYAKRRLVRGTVFAPYHFGAILTQSSAPGYHGGVFSLSSPCLPLTLHGNPFAPCSGPVVNDAWRTGKPVNVRGVHLSRYDTTGHIDRITQVHFSLLQPHNIASSTNTRVQIHAAHLPHLLPRMVASPATPDEPDTPAHLPQVLVALRDIEKDEEILTTYWCGYWVGQGCTHEEHRHLERRDRAFLAGHFGGIY